MQRQMDMQAQKGKEMTVYRTYWTIRRGNKHIGRFESRRTAEMMAHASYGRDWRSLCEIVEIK